MEPEISETLSGGSSGDLCRSESTNAGMSAAYRVRTGRHWRVVVGGPWTTLLTLDDGFLNVTPFRNSPVQLEADMWAYVRKENVFVVPCYWVAKSYGRTGWVVDLPVCTRAKPLRAVSFRGKFEISETRQKQTSPFVSLGI